MRLGSNSLSLCRINRNAVEIKMTNGEMLHELSPQVCRRELGHVLRRDDVITECLHPCRR